MNKYYYSNPFRKEHIILLQYLEKQLVNDKDKIEMYKFGDHTQHIFKNKKYFMTINWELV